MGRPNMPLDAVPAALPVSLVNAAVSYLYRWQNVCGLISMIVAPGVGKNPTLRFFFHWFSATSVSVRQTYPYITSHSPISILLNVGKTTTFGIITMDAAILNKSISGNLTKVCTTWLQCC